MNPHCRNGQHGQQEKLRSALARHIPYIVKIPNSTDPDAENAENAHPAKPFNMEMAAEKPSAAAKKKGRKGKEEQHVRSPGQLGRWAA